jgi:hypothetical protein
MKKFCIKCGKEYQRPARAGVGVWSRRKYCSHKCYWENKHDEPWNKGKTAVTDARILTEEKSCLWKGDNVSYIGLHAWVVKRLGKPNKCELCGRIGKRLEWANKSREYKRDLNDWIRLCYSCHEKYDQVWLSRGRDNLGRFA